MDASFLIHYGTIGTVMGLSSLGVGLGQGAVGKAAVEAAVLQPHARADINRAAILGIALLDTAAIFGITIGILLLTSTNTVMDNWYTGIAYAGIACALGISSLCVGFFASGPVISACYALARHPQTSPAIIRLMLISQTLIQTPLIFGFIISVLIRFGSAPRAQDIYDSLRIIASGLAIGLGSIGPTIGLSRFGLNAVKSLGLNRESQRTVTSFAFISQAIIETPLIFALIIALIVLFMPSGGSDIIKAIKALCAAVCIGLGTYGPSISSSNTASAACTEIALRPENYSIISRLSLTSQALIDTSVIYSLIVAFMCVFI
ncbi:phospholipid carrier-dependent glycosyltransferase [Vermiphilus pyriformis]|nr:MAG: phospholipid carrier-dependent glycosyltransferase [Vermiphilus pyriformis]